MTLSASSITPHRGVSNLNLARTGWPLRVQQLMYHDHEDLDNMAFISTFFFHHCHP